MLNMWSAGRLLAHSRCVVSGCSGCVVMGLIDRWRRSRNGDVHLGKGGVVAFALLRDVDDALCVHRVRV